MHYIYYLESNIVSATKAALSLDSLWDAVRQLPLQALTGTTAGAGQENDNAE